MSDGIKDGGAAFSCFEASPNGYMRIGGGLSIRDYFAGQAMAGMLACPNDKPSVVLNQDHDTGRLAMCAYSIADAMIRAREGK